MSEYYLVPVETNGFEIDSQAAYDLVVYHFTKAAGKIALEHPDKTVLVIWPVEEA